MYQAAIRAIPNNFYTLSTLNRGDGGKGGGGGGGGGPGLKAYFVRKKGVVPQYFVADCRNN